MPATKIVNIYQPGPQKPAGLDESVGQFIGAGQGIYETSSTKKGKIGTRMVVGNRTFRYAYNGGVALKAGVIVGSPLLGGALTTNQTACPVAVAAAIGDSRIFLQAISTAQLAGVFADGWAGFYNNTLTEYFLMQIKNNSAIATTGTTSYIDLYDGIPEALTTSGTVDLLANPYYGIIVFPTGRTPACVALGGVVCPVPINYYCWVQTSGPFFGVQGAEPVVAGIEVGTDDDAAGAVEVYAVAESGPVVGVGMQTGTAGKGALINLNILF